MSRLKRTLAVVTALAASLGGVVATGSPAAAAMPYCNNVSGVYDTSSHLTRYPTYQAGSEKPSVACNMGYYNENGSEQERDAIRSVQWDLVRCYGEYLGPNGIDGEYGWYTREAVKRVQQRLNDDLGAGLTKDGWAGPNTRRWMNHVNVEENDCFGVKDRQPVVPGSTPGDYWSQWWDIGTPYL
ncbi:peptidoglycan-binding protein [Catellatospora sp. NPDC049133]|uniref:peptidoglycan-binding protein n=1 Tax=Catellatospora sp. NPDC049133 TaxID=3155499 RepID=UPI0033F6184D